MSLSGASAPGRRASPGIVAKRSGADGRDPGTSIRHGVNHNCRARSVRNGRDVEFPTPLLHPVGPNEVGEDARLAALGALHCSAGEVESSAHQEPESAKIFLVEEPLEERIVDHILRAAVGVPRRASPPVRKRHEWPDCESLLVQHRRRSSSARGEPAGFGHMAFAVPCIGSQS